MRVREVLRSFVGGFAVYVLVSACSGRDTNSASAGGGGACDCKPPDVAVELCAKTSDANGPTVYAEHLYPGKKAADLATVVALAHLSLTDQTASLVPGYDHTVVANALVADGKVAVLCGAPQSQDYDSVTFVLPNL